jgi:hypothetical protein
VPLGGSTQRGWLRGLDYLQRMKIGHIPLKEGFSAKGFLFKHVKVRKFYMVIILCENGVHLF